MYILFDIGATKMRLAASPDLKKIGKPVILDTPNDFNRGVKLILNTARTLAQNKKIRAIAGGIPGPIDREKTMSVNAPNLRGWNHKPLKKTLAKHLKAPIFLENDTAIVGLGEVWHGAGKSYSKSGIVAYITVSTGVGGVRIVDGKIDRNSIGFEIGAQTIDADGSLIKRPGSYGYLEEYVSGLNVEKRFRRKPYEISDKKVWDKLAEFLAFGINNTIVHWSPDAVIFGGSMMNPSRKRYFMGGVNKVCIPIKRVEFYLNKILKIFPEKPKILLSSLGDLGGLHGAMIYLKQQLN